MSLDALPGFREFYPAELAERNFIIGTWREVARRYGFAEYDGPPLEPLELYTKKSGDEIVGQLYSFTDKGGREVSLRPEMTPTLARMVAAKSPAVVSTSSAPASTPAAWTTPRTGGRSRSAARTASAGHQPIPADGFQDAPN